MFRLPFFMTTAVQSTAEMTQEKKCEEAKKAAWIAKPKVYRLNPSKPHETTIRVENTFPNNLKNITIIDDYSQTSVPSTQPKEKTQPFIDPERPARFYALGCQGDAKEAQLKVAELMNQIASQSIEPPDFILLLGDNFYDFGVDSPDDNMFTNNFYDVYSNPKFKCLRKIPCFVILGNHDENLHKVGDYVRKYSFDMLAQEKGIEKGMHQVAHSYLPKECYKNTTDLQNLYCSNREDDEIVDLNVDKLPAWNMPSRTYALICGNTQIFCIDSNTYVSDYLNLINGDTNPANQALWLMKEVDKARTAGRQVVLALHHPLITPGKRAFHNDIDLYLSEDERTSKIFLKYFGHLMQDKGPSYNQLIREAMMQQKLAFDAIFTAHDHDMYYYNNKNNMNDYPVCQVTSGGGGGKLQTREDFDEQQYMGCFLKYNGFTDVRCPVNGPMHFYLHTIPKSGNDRTFHLHFDSDDCKPYRLFSEKIVNDKQSIESLCGVVMSAINEYMAFLAPRQTKENGGFLGWGLKGNTKHGYEGVERVHKLWAYINNEIADDYETTLRSIYSLSLWNSTYTSPSEHSFITILDQKIAENYDGHTTHSLYLNMQTEKDFSLKL